MEKSSEYFFRLPFILYPEKVPKNIFIALERALISLYAYDEIKKSSFFKKGEKLKSISKIHLPFLVYKDSEQNLIFSKLLNFKPYIIDKFPTRIPVLPDKLQSMLPDEFANSLNSIYSLINNLEVKIEILENSLPLKLIEDIEYLLYYPGMSQALKNDYIIIDPILPNKKAHIEENIRKIVKGKSFLKSLKDYLEKYPDTQISTGLERVIQKFDLEKKKTYQSYEKKINDVKIEIEKKISELEYQRNENLLFIEKKFFSKKENNLKPTSDKLNKILNDLQNNQFKAYNKEQFTEIKQYIDFVKNNYNSHLQTWEKYQKEYQEVLSSHNKINDEEKRAITDLNTKFDSDILNENKKMSDIEEERDRKISDLEDKENYLKNQVKNLKSVFETRILEIKLIEEKIKGLSLNIINHPLYDNFKEDNENSIGLPFYVIHIQSLEETNVHRFAIIPPIIFPDHKITNSKKYHIYGDNPDGNHGYVGFNVVSNELNEIANEILLNITYHSKTSSQRPKKLLLTREDVIKILNSNNLLLDPYFETSVYDGLDWINRNNDFISRRIENKVRNQIIHFFDDLHKLILKQQNKS